MQQALNIHAKFPYMNEHPITGAFTGLTHKTKRLTSTCSSTA